MTEFRQWLKEFTERVKHAPAADIACLADELVGQMLKFSAQGDPDAERMIREYLYSAAETRIKAWSRSADKVKTVTRGKVKVKPTRYSMTTVDAETGDLVGREHRSIWDIPREEFRQKMLAINAQSAAMLDTRKTFAAVWSNWIKYPEADTARKAWHLAGRSTDEINLDGVA